MTNIEQAIGYAVAGAVSTIAVILLAKPIFDVFGLLAKQSPTPGMMMILAGVLLLAIAVGIFQKMTES